MKVWGQDKINLSPSYENMEPHYESMGPPYESMDPHYESMGLKNKRNIFSNYNNKNFF